MKVEIKSDTSCIDPRVIVFTHSMTEEVNNIVKILTDNTSQILSAYKDGKIEKRVAYEVSVGSLEVINENEDKKEEITENQEAV